MGIYDLMQGIQQQGEEGRKRGLQALVGKAYAAPQDQRQQILATVARRGEPGMALEADKAFGAQEDNVHLQMAKRAREVVALYKANPAMAQQIYQNGLIPIAQRAGIQNAPMQLDDSLIPGLENLASAAKDSDGTPAQQQYAEWLLSQVPEDQRDQTLGVLAGYKPRPSSAAIQYKEVMGDDGVTRWVAMDPREVGSQVIGGGQTFGSGVGSTPSMGGGQTPSGLTQAMIGVESGGDPNAVSPAGAHGLMQVMPDTARDPGFGVQPMRNGSPQENVRMGQDYMQAMLRKYGGNQMLALAAYNGGPGRVDQALQQAGGDPQRAMQYLPQETQQYPGKVLARMGGQANPFQSRPQEQQKYLDARATQQAQIDTQPTINTLEAQGAGAKKTAELDAQRESDRIDNAPKAASALSAAKMAGESVNRAITQAIPNVNVWTTGLIGQPLSKLNTPQAANLRASLDTIEANIAFDRLQQMRMSSPTGGALGSISERELTLLGSTITSLKQSQSPAQLRSNLQFLQKQYAKVLGQLESDFKRDFGSARPSPAGGNNVIRYDAQGNRLP